MANKIRVARGTKTKIETIKASLKDYELVYSTDTFELGVKNSNGTITYIGRVDTIEWANVLNKPTFSTVSQTGNYNDLTNKPDLTTKLDKNFSALPNQASLLLTDVLVINRGTVAQKTTLGNLLGQVDTEIFVVVETLPTTGVVNKIYLLPKTTPEGQNVYDEYIWVNNAWKLIGSIELDLSKVFTNEIRELNYKVKNIEAEIRDKFDANTTITESGYDLTIKPNGEGNVSVLSIKGISDLNELQLPDDFVKISDLEYRYTNGAFNVSYDVLTGVFTANGKPSGSIRLYKNLGANKNYTLQVWYESGNTTPLWASPRIAWNLGVDVPTSGSIQFRYEEETYKRINANTDIISMYFSSSMTFNNYKYKLMLSEGNSTPIYSPKKESIFEITATKRIKIGGSELYLIGDQIINDINYITYNEGSYIINNEIINSSGILVAEPNANVIVSNHTKQAVVYNNGANLKHNIKSIEKILVLNTEGTETLVTANSNISGKTFTNTGISNNSLIYVVYEIDKLEYSPLLEISYYNGGEGFASQDDLNQVKNRVTILENNEIIKSDFRGVNIMSGVTIPTNTRGLTITYNEELNRLVINGTTTSTGEIILNNTNVKGSIFRRLKYVSGTVSNISENYWGNTASGTMIFNEYSYTYYTENYDYYMLRIRVFTGTIFNNYTFEPQISYAEEGEDIPYVLPNKIPDYVIVGEVTGKTEEELIELRPYEKNELDLVIDKVDENANSNTLDFVILTDTQNDDLPNERVVRSFAQIQHFLNRNKVDFVAHLGDIINGSGRVNGIERLKFWTKQMQNLTAEKIITLGNHDDGNYGTDYYPLPNNIINHQELYNIVVKPNVNGANFNNSQENGLYYYKDLEDKKIRIVVLDSIDYPNYLDGQGRMKYSGKNFWGFGEKQIQWLAHEALNIKKSKLDYKDWAVMIMTHVPNRSDVSYYAQNENSINNAIVTDILNAFKLGQQFVGTSSQSIPEEPTHVDVDFTSQGNMELIGYFNGHGHIDIMGRPDGVEYTYRMTACNNSGVKRSSTGSASVDIFENPTRVNGTITETAWDVVNVDRNTKTVKVTRYGAGNDVSWTWD